MKHQVNKKPLITRAEHNNVIYDDKAKKASEKYDGSIPALMEAQYKIEKERKEALEQAK
jgi:hypothetical protein